jgi:hypothetical protein
MRCWTNCKLCAELVFFDIEEVTTPSDILPIGEKMEERFGLLDPNLLYNVCKEWADRKGFKEVRLFKNCPKCGALITFINWMPLN